MHAWIELQFVKNRLMKSMKFMKYESLEYIYIVIILIFLNLKLSLFIIIVVISFLKTLLMYSLDMLL